MLSTSYSGMGAPETTMAMLAESVREKGGEFSVYSATDIDATCQKVLCSHHGVSAPKQIFGDLVCRLEKKYEDEVRAFTRKTLSRSHWPKDASVDFKGQVLFDGLCTRLAGAKFQDTNFCKKHQSQCPLLPPKGSGGLMPRSLHLEVCGVCCVAWSTMNRGHHCRWFHESALPCLVQTFFLRHMRPALIVIECVRNFDADAMLSVLEENHLYSSFQVVFSPTDLGVPTARLRRYSVALSTEHFAEIRDLEPEKRFQELFFKTLVVDVACYMVASAATILDAKVSQAERA